MTLLFFILLFVSPAFTTTHTARDLPDEFLINISGENPNIPMEAPVILNENQDVYKLDSYLEILEDPTGKLTIENITSSEYIGRFGPGNEDVPNFGYTNSVYWVRFCLRNETNQTENWRLKLDFADMQNIDLYIQMQDSEEYIHKKTGTYLPFKTRDIPYPKFVFKIPLKYGTGQIVYMRFENEASMTIPLSLFTVDEFSQQSNNEQLFSGFFYGILFLILGYSLIMLLFMAERSYFYFIFFITSFILFHASYDGFASQYLWPEHALFNHFAVPFLGALFIISSLKFTSVFLQTKFYFPVFHKSINVWLIFYGLAIISIFVFSISVVTRLMIIFTLICSFSILIFCFVIWYKKYRPVRYFIFAWITFLVSGSTTELVRLGIVHSNTYTEYGFRIGILLLFFLLSLALADRLRIRRKEKERLASEQTGFLRSEITDRTKALKESEEKYRGFFKTSTDCVYITSKDGKWLDMSDSAPEFFGYISKEELQKVNIRELYKNPPDRELHISEIEQQGSTKDVLINLKKKDGSVIKALISSVAIKDGDGNLVAFQGSIRDITAQKEAEIKLKKNQKYLQELNASKDKFFSIISHDLRSPFNSILGFTELLWKNSEAFSKAEIEIIAYDIYKTGNETIDLLNNLLEWSSSQTGKLKINPENFILKSVVDDTIDLLNDYAKKKNITVLNEVPGQTEVSADKNMISSVIRNLLSNAIKFTQNGDVKITAKDVNSFVEFSITDTGVGIKPEDIKKLFRLDTEFSTPGTAKEKGSGLGLILCKEFIEKNKGKIYVESEKGKGTSFMFKLPKTKN